MKDFKAYLKRKTIPDIDIEYWVNKHKKWCKLHRTTCRTIKYKEIILYVEHLTKQYQKKETVNSIIAKVKHYYDYLLEDQQIKRNLFDNKYLTREKKRIYKNITSPMHVPNLFD